MEYNLQSKHFWGESTATIQWCEEKYAVCMFISEFWNTLSSFLYIYVAFHGIVSCIRMKLEARYIMSYAGMIIVGFGSIMFHATSLYEWQLADELPMIYVTSISVYCAYEAGNLDKPNMFVSFGLFLYCVVVTVVYLFLKFPVFHQVAYGILNLMVLYLLVFKHHQIVKTSVHRKMFTKLIRFIVFGFGIAFFLWNVDNIFCNQLRFFRQQTAYFIAPFTQFHMYWHFGTAFACYNAILYQQLLRLAHLGLDRDVELMYHNFVIPYIRARNDGQLKNTIA